MESVAKEPGLRFQRYQTHNAGAWKNFLLNSNNGTLFHDLDFLAYHAEGKFEVHHLMIYQGDTLVALLPAAIVEKEPGRRFLQSPYGASVGGFVLPAKLKVATTLEMVRGLQAYARQESLAGIEMRLPPSSYLREPNDLLPFILQISGFTLKHSSLVFMASLHGPREGLADRLLSATKRKNVRSNLRKGVFPREVDPGKLADFYALLLDNWSRHNAVPTHSYSELQNLFQLVPGKLRLFLCQHEGIEIAGVLVFILNEVVANTFYLCELQSLKQDLRGPAVLNSHLIDRMAEEGFRYLDLGPSISDAHYNEGAVYFKEQMGAQGFARQTWCWANPAVDEKVFSSCEAK
jgi:hypothetical protein